VAVVKSYAEFIEHPFVIADQVRLGTPIVFADDAASDLVLISREEYERYEDQQALADIYKTLIKKPDEANTDSRSAENHYGRIFASKYRIEYLLSAEDKHPGGIRRGVCRIGYEQFRKAIVESHIIII